MCENILNIARRNPDATKGRKLSPLVGLIHLIVYIDNLKIYMTELTVENLKHNRLTSGELISNDRRAAGLVSSYPRERGLKRAADVEGATVGRGNGVRVINLSEPPFTQ